MSNDVNQSVMLRRKTEKIIPQTIIQKQKLKNHFEFRKNQ